MRIAINGWFAGQIATGSGQYLAGLLAGLSHAGPGHELILVTPALGREAHATERAPELQKLPVFTPFDRIDRDLAKLWFEQVTFPAACRRLGADIAFVPYWGSPWWRPCPTVVTVHDLIPLLLPLYRGGPLQRAYTALVSRTARRAHAVLTDSEAGKRDVVAQLGIEPGRVHAVHLAADPRFQPATDPEVRARVHARYGLPEGPFLLYIGGFDARKNVVRMLEGYAATVRRAATDARSGDSRSGSVFPLVIAGRLPDAGSAFAPDPRPVVARLGIEEHVHFTGWVDEADKPALYSLARAALYLSEYEGFGLPVLEAMGCGCAVMAGS